MTDLERLLEQHAALEALALEIVADAAVPRTGAELVSPKMMHFAELLREHAIFEARLLFPNLFRAGEALVRHHADQLLEEKRPLLAEIQQFAGRWEAPTRGRRLYRFELVRRLSAISGSRRRSEERARPRIHRNPGTALTR